jgi:hypothetical protein
MRNTKLIWLAVISLAAFTSCKKELSVQKEKSNPELDQSKIYKLPVSPEEKLLVQNLAKLGHI